MTEAFAREFIDDDDSLDAAKVTRQALIDTQERMGMMFDIMPMGLLIHTRQGILFANQEACRMLGGLRDQLVGQHILDFVAQSEVSRVMEQIDRSFESGIESINQETLLHNPRGRVISIKLISVRLPWAGTPVIQLLLQDVTDLKLKEQQLQRLSIIDELTGIHNRRHVFSEAARHLEVADRSSFDLSVALLDVDHFKKINARTRLSSRPDLCVWAAAPAGLYFAISMKLRDPVARGRRARAQPPDDTFGWGVVLSDETLENLPPTIRSAPRRSASTSPTGTTSRSSTRACARLGRPRLLRHRPQEDADPAAGRARELGVDLRFETEFEAPRITARRLRPGRRRDGINSKTAAEYADVFKPDIDQRKCKFVWLGTHQKFDDAFTFIFEKTEHGWVWAHAYQFDDDTATFIVECRRRPGTLGLRADVQEESIETCRGDLRGSSRRPRSLMTNAAHLRGSAWMNFPRVLCEKWYHENVVLMGDAAATGAFLDRVGLQAGLRKRHRAGRLPAFRADMEGFRALSGRAPPRGAAPAVGGAQLAGMVRGGRALPRPRPGAVQLFAADPLAAHQPREPAPARSRMAAPRPRLVPGAGGRQRRARAPMFAPFKLRDMELKNRVVVSPMAQYKAVDGCPTDWHLIHYGERAKGGAGLVYTEMTCVSAGRPDHAGLPRGSMRPNTRRPGNGWSISSMPRPTRRSAARSAIPAARARPSSAGKRWTRRWKTATGRCSPLRHPWSDGNATPREMDRADMDMSRTSSSPPLKWPGAPAST
jgi:anthraniloyl-CoA monooxygenase